MKSLRHSFLGFIFLLVACTGESTGDVSVSRILVSGQLNAEGQIAIEQIEFPSTQEAIHVHVFVENLNEAIIVRGDWWYDGGEEPVKVYEASVTIDPEKPVGMFTLQTTQQWPAGDYRFEFFHGAERLGEAVFSVTQ